MPKKREELMYLAEGVGADGHTRAYSIYKSGGSFVIDSVSPNGASRQRCHAGVRTEDNIKSELGLLFNVTETSLKRV